MRFTLSSTALSNKLAALSRVINSKNALPILGDFVFEINGQTLRLTASDSENTMHTTVPLTESDGDGRFAIGNHDLLEAVKGFTEQPITFDADLQANLVKITYQNGLFSLPIESADEFPIPQTVGDNASVIVISNQLLAENINRSIFATAQDELRPVMNGIYFDLTPDYLAVVASDGHKLVRNKIFSVKSDVPASFILPKKPASLLKNLLGKDGGDVIIRFHVEGSMLQLDAEDYDFSKTATERMTCDYNGQPMSIGFKGSSFIEVLSNFDCPEVVIQLADPSRAGLVLPSEQPENQDVLMLMMPMLINE